MVKMIMINSTRLKNQNYLNVNYVNTIIYHAKNFIFSNDTLKFSIEKANPSQYLSLIRL